MPQLISDVCQGLRWEPANLLGSCPRGEDGVSVQRCGHLGRPGRQSGVWASGGTGPSETGLFSLGENCPLSWASVSSFDTFFRRRGEHQITCSVLKSGGG